MTTHLPRFADVNDPVTSPENVPAFIEAVKRREKTLSGFGHRYVTVERRIHRAPLTQTRTVCTRP